MTEKERTLCLEIAKGDYFADGFKNKQSPFYKICQVQKDFEHKHLPEPWNGKLSEAKIMYISSNPSIDENELYPTTELPKWPDDKIIDYFENRFANGKQSIDGTIENGSIPFWSSLIKITDWIFEEYDIPKIRGEKNIAYKNYYRVLNEYIVSTEIVHCKSKAEIGVEECRNESFKWMNEIIPLFNGKLIVLLGKFAKDYYDPISKLVGNRDIKILQLSHPNARIGDEERQQEIKNAIG